jgi:hypothetical protein
MAIDPDPDLVENLQKRFSRGGPDGCLRLRVRVDVSSRAAGRRAVRHLSGAYFDTEPDPAPRDDEGMDEYREIVSNIVRTPGGGEAWIEMNLSGFLTERCTGCGIDEPVESIAAGLQWLTEHAPACDVRR